MKITLEELREVFNKIFNQLQTQSVKEFQLKADLYWYVPKDLCYNPYKIPTDKELTLGELSSDITELKKVLNNEITPVPYHLIWLASILRAIGDEI